MLSGGRKDDAVLAWDARDSGDVICQWPRPVDTNQRLRYAGAPGNRPLRQGPKRLTLARAARSLLARFHVDASGKYLIMGQASGRVDVYDLQAGLASGHPGEPVLQWQAHQSAGLLAHALWAFAGLRAVFCRRSGHAISHDRPARPAFASSIRPQAVLWRLSSIRPGRSSRPAAASASWIFPTATPPTTSTSHHRHRPSTRPSVSGG